MSKRILMCGNEALAEAAILAGCDAYFGYPITPQNEITAYMSRRMAEEGRVFVQSESELAAINMVFGAAATGKRTMTSSSSPGISLMQEGISYLAGAELPAVVVNVMRGGPGLGNIGPEQGDIKLVCRGLGHGNTHTIVLAPSNPQEMLDLAMLAFDLAFEYRNPIVIAGDGYLGQVTGRVTLPEDIVHPGLPEWAVYGDAAHRGNLHTSIYLNEPELEAHNVKLNDKYQRMIENEQRSECFHCEDAEWIVIACNTPARMSKGAVQALRARGVKVGLFRPITLWPFPIEALKPLLAGKRGIVVVEAGPGQLEDEVRLALSHAGVASHPPIHRIQRFGGVLPQLEEIVEHVAALAGGHNG